MNTSFNKRRFAGALTLLLACSTLASNPLQPGDPFPELNQFHLEGSLPDLKGKVVLVDFFASWCDPCNESFPVMQDLHQQYADRGVVILAVNVDKKAEAMEGFLKKHSVDFPVVRDAANQLVAATRIATMPSSFLIDREGRVHTVHRGFQGEKTRQAYIEALEALLK